MDYSSGLALINCPFNNSSVSTELGKVYNPAITLVFSMTSLTLLVLGLKTLEYENALVFNKRIVHESVQNHWWAASFLLLSLSFAVDATRYAWNLPQSTNSLPQGKQSDSDYLLCSSTLRFAAFCLLLNALLKELNLPDCNLGLILDRSQLDAVASSSADEEYTETDHLLGNTRNSSSNRWTAYLLLAFFISNFITKYLFSTEFTKLWYFFTWTIYFFHAFKAFAAIFVARKLVYLLNSQNDLILSYNPSIIRILYLSFGLLASFPLFFEQSITSKYLSLYLLEFATPTRSFEDLACIIPPFWWYKNDCQLHGWASFIDLFHFASLFGLVMLYRFMQLQFGYHKEHWVVATLMHIRTSFAFRTELNALLLQSDYQSVISSLDLHKEYQQHFPAFIKDLFQGKTGIDLKSLEFNMKKNGLGPSVATLFPTILKFLVAKSQKNVPFKKLLKLGVASEWFTETRKISRTFVLHVGPTNSGKTYQALEKLKQAESAVYCGPLRLLAHEIYDRLNSQGIPCNLVTGEERRIVQDIHRFSCTVEMVDFEKCYDIAVIDEIQMIASSDRGWAWTSAVLGLKAKEIHLCGEESVVGLIQKIAQETGDKVIVNRYQRLNQLQVMEQSIKNDLSKIRKGDALIVFGRYSLFDFKEKIEKKTGLKCAMIYGALPPEIRAKQAQLFNDPDSEYKVLVATDAIGMGLNLHISRVIFSSIYKVRQLLNVSETKQIAGRAGRYGLSESAGQVTGLYKEFIPHLKNSLNSKFKPIKKAGVLLNYEQFRAAVKAFPDLSISRVLDIQEALTDCGDLYFSCDYTTLKHISAIIEQIPLSIKDRYTFLMCPVKKAELYMDTFALAKFARARSDGVCCSLYSMIKLPETAPSDLQSLQGLETVNSVITMYLWLANRMPETFHELNVAYQLRKRCHDLINECLLKLNIKGKSDYDVLSRRVDLFFNKDS